MQITTRGTIWREWILSRLTQNKWTQIQKTRHLTPTFHHLRETIRSFQTQKFVSMTKQTLEVPKINFNKQIVLLLVLIKALLDHKLKSKILLYNKFVNGWNPNNLFKYFNILDKTNWIILSRKCIERALYKRTF
jgi:hypothetical protein